ncbi:MAG: HPr family phosphocarrier protein [Kiloniellales bacterium]|nr:HPr family phosphocarrier protein [Kiloniellales bacterium]
MTDETVAEGRTIISHDVGLHARPAVKLTQLAASFSSEVRLRVGDGGDWVDAKSIVKVMKLKARTSETLFFEARGADAQQAVAALVHLVERRFDEQPA